MKNKMKSVILVTAVILTAGLFSASVSAATGIIQIKDPNGGNIKVITIDSNDVVCNSEEAVTLTYCPPQLEENDPAIARIVEVGSPTERRK